jgi:hypothetical protein
MCRLRSSCADKRLPPINCSPPDDCREFSILSVALSLGKQQGRAVLTHPKMGASIPKSLGAGCASQTRHFRRVSIGSKYRK